MSDQLPDATLPYLRNITNIDSEIKNVIENFTEKDDEVDEKIREEKEEQCDTIPAQQDSDEDKYSKKKLLCIQDMPEHLKFNPYIIDGYRPLQPPLDCVKSVFQWHNESVNIITHAIPIFFILLTVPEVLPWHTKELTFLAYCHIAGILCPWLGSCVYHMFMSLEYGPTAYYVLLQTDMLGIWTSQSIGALPLVFASSKCLPGTIHWGIITLYCSLSLWGLYKAMTAWSPWDRRACFLLMFMTRIALWGLRFTSNGGGDQDVFIHIILQDVVSILGGCIGAIHVPEKWFPGRVDMFLNSHNIMHVLVLAAVWSMHKATAADLNWMAYGQCRNYIESKSVWQFW